ncbi:adenylyl-sulfate kinase [Sphingosinicella sp. BN140058]|uniref:adenylyl-sulfate kinase n=1 Tax=Sphingosinicella sp. BN140058 TaxID=1892855 RepID=UPI0010113F49|nr:adenylyl-sulfate kinase [Sphingosinicella sp. BN140058]QAY76748.1 adenylyl-sulfate kinase [Sphingosinicella sp. BN140058]
MGGPGAKGLLRFITCGSVDDGKSTLLGRLLAETGSTHDGELAACGGDPALLVDGLEAEREQGITIDLAYRFFATPRRSFIVADAPGHEQYTRNLVTGATTADLALVLVDAAKGVLTQTRRHSFLCRLLGVGSVVLVVNKMDLASWDQAVFDRIVADYRAVASDFTAIPVSAAAGDNVVRRSEAMPWYVGPTLIEHLEEVVPQQDRSAEGPFRMPVQWVSRASRRSFAGFVASGAIRPGDSVRVMPAGTLAAIDDISLGDATMDEAVAGQSIAISLASEVDCSRGDVLVGADAPPEVADQFEATLIWLSEEELTPGRQYDLKLGSQSALATIQPPKHEIDVNSFDELPARTLGLNGIGVAEFWTDRPIVFAPYRDCRDLGGFILIDRITNDTVGAGLIHFALRRSHNLHPQALDISREARAAMKGQRQRLLWFTGLSGAGKSTIANLVEKKLHALGRHSFLLDGDNVRLGLNRDLGFTDADRAENIRRVGETAKLMLDAGLIVLAAFISPFRAERRMVRALIPEGEFVEIFIDAPLAEAERRDPKGLYAKARQGRLPNFTGIGSPYEPPEQAELVIDTTRLTAEQAADEIIRYLLRS